MLAEVVCFDFGLKSSGGGGRRCISGTGVSLRSIIAILEIHRAEQRNSTARPANRSSRNG